MVKELADRFRVSSGVAAQTLHALIHDGVVEIAGIAREAGMRTKIAVRSNDPRVDPVGACVGMRGMRVRNITNELGNERVDIIRYDENIKTYAANALHPARSGSISMLKPLSLIAMQ